MKAYLLAGCLLAGLPLAFGQSPEAVAIALQNPSFEGTPDMATLPPHWQDCGFPNETPPDIQPNPFFGVKAAAIHGNTFLGMVTRDNVNWERIGQPLPTPLVQGQCYGLSFSAARSDDYWSVSRISQALVNYNLPVKLRLWGGLGTCNRKQLLTETPFIGHKQWEYYTLTFHASAPFTYLVFEAYYVSNEAQPYSGNLLLDDLSLILPIDCADSLSVRKIPVAKEKIPALSAKDEENYFEYEPPAEGATLEEILPKFSRLVAFTDDHTLERGHYYHYPTQKLVDENPYLDHIIILFKRMNGARLLIAVPGETTFEVEQKMAEVKKTLHFFNAPRKAIELLPFSKADPGLRWMGSKKGLLFYLQPKS